MKGIDLETLKRALTEVPEGASTRGMVIAAMMGYTPRAIIAFQGAMPGHWAIVAWSTIWDYFSTLGLHSRIASKNWKPSGNARLDDLAVAASHKIKWCWMVHNNLPIPHQQRESLYQHWKRFYGRLVPVPHDFDTRDQARCHLLGTLWCMHEALLVAAEAEKGEVE